MLGFFVRLTVQCIYLNNGIDYIGMYDTGRARYIYTYIV